MPMIDGKTLLGRRRSQQASSEQGNDEQPFVLAVTRRSYDGGELSEDGSGMTQGWPWTAVRPRVGRLGHISS